MPPVGRKTTSRIWLVDTRSVFPRPPALFAPATVVSDSFPSVIPLTFVPLTFAPLTFIPLTLIPPTIIPLTIFATGSPCNADMRFVSVNFAVNLPAVTTVFWLLPDCVITIRGGPLVFPARSSRRPFFTTKSITGAVISMSCPPAVAPADVLMPLLLSACHSRTPSSAWTIFSICRSPNCSVTRPAEACAGRSACAPAASPLPASLRVTSCTLPLARKWPWSADSAFPSKTGRRGRNAHVFWSSSFSGWMIASFWTLMNLRREVLSPHCPRQERGPPYCCREGRMWLDRLAWFAIPASCVRRRAPPGGAAW